jgi:hypothetical protein
MPRFAAPSPRYLTVAPPARRPNFYQNQQHHGYSADRHGRIRTYPRSVIGFLPADLLDESFYDDSNYGQPVGAQPDVAPQPDYAGSGYPEPGPENYPPQPDQEQPAPVTPEMQYVPSSADAVTLVFKDGRPPEQIHNYLATSKTLTVIDGNHHREIPVADLDVSATVKANRETGVGFQLPGATP